MDIMCLQYLQQAVQGSQELFDKSQLLAEVEYVMEFPWNCRVPRWEAWNFIKIFRQENNSSVSMKGDYEWWDETNKELSATRLCFAKVGSLITLIDDIFDTYGTINELIPFAKTLIEWDMSMMDHLPNYMKTSFQFAHKTYMDIATEAEKIHGPCVHEWMHDYWKSLILVQLQDVEWIANDYQPSLEEYLKSSLISTTILVLSFFPMLLINTFFHNDIIERINTFESYDDSKDFQDEKERGEKASWIEYYIKDNPGTTREKVYIMSTCLLR
ncbi:hypothetical protein SUGI_0795080 [Cryptomeria japonica]|nr:hypothetical protein SUGI_0795080 [Cryptomeria japonica]